MSPALRSFMSGLVDYAGLFPPAGLDMAPAAANYARYRGLQEAWMLGRFICPAGRLEELGHCLPPGFADRGPWELSVLAGDARGPDEALAALPGQVRAMQAMQERFAGRVAVAALEIPLPQAAVRPGGSFLDEALAALAGPDLAGREIYFEVPAAGDQGSDQEALTAIAALRERVPGDRAEVGAKFRCGGVTASAFPAVERLAGVVHHCRRLQLPLKFTAGLHHPVRHRASEPEVMMHGFFNVFGAGLLAHGTAAGLAEVEACLAETDPSAFAFTGQGFAWRDHQVPAQAVASIRREMLRGFGSCSFDDPRRDLTALGLLS